MNEEENRTGKCETIWVQIVKENFKGVDVCESITDKDIWAIEGSGTGSKSVHIPVSFIPILSFSF